MKEIRWRVFCNGFHHWTISVSFIITISRSHWSRGFERFCASPPSTTFLWTSAINSFIQESVSHWTHTPEHLSSSHLTPNPLHSLPMGPWQEAAHCTTPHARIPHVQLLDSIVLNTFSFSFIASSHPINGA